MPATIRTAASTRSRRSHLPENRRLQIPSSPLPTPAPGTSKSRSSRRSTPSRASPQPSSSSDASGDQIIPGPSASFTSSPTPAPAPAPVPAAAANSSEPFTPIDPTSPVRASKPFDIRGKIIPQKSAEVMFKESTNLHGHYPTVFETYEAAMSSERQAARRFFRASDGKLRAVFKHIPQPQMVAPAELNRKRKADIAETRLISQEEAPIIAALPIQPPMTDQFQEHAQQGLRPIAYSQIQVEGQKETPQADVSHRDETQASGLSFLRRVRNRIFTVYNAVDRNTVTSGFRHAYGRVAQTFARLPASQPLLHPLLESLAEVLSKPPSQPSNPPLPRPQPQPQGQPQAQPQVRPLYDAVEVHGISDGGPTVKRIHCSTQNRITVKRFKRLPHNIRDRKADGHNTLRPDLIPNLVRFEWTEDVRKYIGAEDLRTTYKFLGTMHYHLSHECWYRFLKYWLEDEHQHLIHIADLELPKEDWEQYCIPVSIAMHNYLIANKSKVTIEDVRDTVQHWARLSKEAMDMIDTMYNQNTLRALKRTHWHRPPTERFVVFRQTGYNKAYFRKCAEFLVLFVEQGEAMGLSDHREALTLGKIAMDFDAFHKEEIPVSYVDWEAKETMPMPGTYPRSVEDALFDQVPLKELKFDFLYNYRAPDADAAGNPPPQRNDLVTIQKNGAETAELYPARGILAGREQMDEARPAAPDQSSIQSQHTSQDIGPTLHFRVPSETDSQVSPMDVDDPPQNTSAAARFAANAEGNPRPGPPPLDIAMALQSPEHAELESRILLANQISNMNVSRGRATAEEQASAAGNVPLSRTPRRARPRVGFVSPVAFYTSPIRQPSARVPESSRPESSTNGNESVIPGGRHSSIDNCSGLHDHGLELEQLLDTTLHISDAKREEHATLLEERRTQEEEERRRAEKAEREARRLREEKQRQEEEARLALTGGLRRPTQPLIPTLSETWEMRVAQTLSAGMDVELAKSPEGSRLTRRDFEKVVPSTEWLNDEIVNSGLYHIATFVNKKAGIENPKVQTPKCHVFNSFFGSKLALNGAEGTERQMRRAGVRKDNFLDIDTILVPICRNNHWTLVVVRPTHRAIAHMDSLRPHGAGNPELTSKTLKWVQGVLQGDFDGNEWNIVNYTSPTQGNSWDCGVHAVTNGICLALGIDPIHYRSQDLPLQRRRIAAVVLNGGFTGDFDIKL